MQLSEKIDSLKKRKIDLTKKARKCKSAYVRVLTRSKIASTLIELIHFRNILKDTTARHKKQLKVHVGIKGIRSNSVAKKLNKKYAKRLIKHSNKQVNTGIPGTHLTEIPNTFVTNEPKVKGYADILNNFAKLKIKAVAYSYAVDSNNEIWYGNVFLITKKHTLRSLNKLKQKLLKREIKNERNNIVIPDVIDANKLQAI
jgi:hypothetical protein